MKLTASWMSLLMFLSVLLTSVAAWTNEDHEIFDLVSALEAAEGPKTNFYSYLNVTPSATTAEIARQFRKRSLELHPDRGGDEARYARLGVIAEILKDDEKRKRYHHFYVNGVPRWRGTGYYYARYRPGLGTVLVFLSILSVLIQYMVQHLTRYSEVARIKRFQSRAREAAFGSASHRPANPSLKKKVRVALGGSESSAVTMVVEGTGKVSIVDDQTGQAHVLDENAASKPALSKTWLSLLLKAAYYKIANKPATPLAIPDSTELGGVDAVPTPVDSEPGTPIASGARTPAEDGGPVNRKQRRAEAKQLNKKKK